MAEDEQLQHVPISVDTFHAEVAAQAVQAGACMVNDVSGGSMDPHMYQQVLCGQQLAAFLLHDACEEHTHVVMS